MAKTPKTEKPLDKMTKDELIKYAKAQGKTIVRLTGHLDKLREGVATQVEGGVNVTQHEGSTPIDEIPAGLPDVGADNQEPPAVLPWDLPNAFRGE